MFEVRNDYYAPGFRNPIGYLLPDNGQRATHTPLLPWWELRDAFTESGWLDLTNRGGAMTGAWDHGRVRRRR